MKLNIGVFFGGKSTEHEISCISANQAIHALDENKYNVIPIYISKNNEFYTGEKLFDLSNYWSIVPNPEKELEKVTIYKDGNKVMVKPVKQSLFRKDDKSIDVAFPVVHGTNVEDGSLAGFLEMLDLPYTSCNVLGGAVGQDKAVMKDIFKANGIPMVEHFIINGYDFDKDYDSYLEKAKAIGTPLIAKPANLGSSVGISTIRSMNDFKAKIKDCLNYDGKVVVEHMISKLKEVNISVMGSVDNPKVSVIEEVTNGFLDYEKKYLGGSSSSKKTGPVKAASKSGSSKGMASTARKIPADITKEQKKQIEEIAVKVFRILNAHGCVRIDFMIDMESNTVYANEINTIPGSLSFYLWKEVGIDFASECDMLINNALKRYAQKEKRTYSFDTNILDGYRRK